MVKVVVEVQGEVAEAGDADTVQVVAFAEGAVLVKVDVIVQV